MEEKPDEFLPTRASLPGRLKNWQDQASWQEFYEVYRRLILGAALRAGLSQGEAEEVLQETLLSVAKAIPQFDYEPSRCKFKSWLGLLTQKRIADQFRKRARNPAAPAALPDASGTTPWVERLPAPESLSLEEQWETEWQQRLLETALERIKKEVNPEQYQMFDFCVLRKLPVKEVAALLQVSAGRVYLAKHRIARALQKEVQHLESRMG